MKKTHGVEMYAGAPQPKLGDTKAGKEELEKKKNRT